MKNKSAHILIKNGTVITCNSEDTIIHNGAVAVQNDQISAIGTADFFSDWEISQFIDAQGGIIMPGLINTHTHLPMSLFRGLADDLPLMTWLNDHIFPAEQKHINPENVRLGTLLSCAEMILSGTTTCCDGYFYEDSIAEAVYESGMRAVLGQGVIDFSAPGVPDPSKNIKNAVLFAEKWQGRYTTITPSIFCHSPYTCCAKTLTDAKNAAEIKGILFQIHVSETKNEVSRMKAEHNMFPVEYLGYLGILNKNTLLVHSIWINKKEIAIIAKSESNVSHNPESNMKLASGISPVPDLIHAGVTVGLGTDGCASNNDLDLFQEMDTAAKLHKAAMLDPTVLDAPTVLRMATIEGARAIGLDRITGSLETGKQADIIVIDTNKPHLVPMYHPVSHLVYSVRGSDVRDVMVAGKIIVKNYNIQTIQLKNVIQDVSIFSQSI
ncbi:MAG: amidohydrolase [Desulfobacterales bacterium]|nr:amidohydrolase [Desulfobacterales bacterium]